FGRAVASTSLTFISKAAMERDVPKKLGLERRIVAVKDCRSVKKRDLKLNDALPKIEVDPETYKVTADGVHLTCEPIIVQPMAQRYFLF
ncbi:MAG TPA: urease subunit alpha, partial [Nitrospiraceae bacterium]